MDKAYELCTRISGIYWLAKSQVLYKRYLGALGRRSRIIKPLKMTRMEKIFIGEDVTVNALTWLFTFSPEGHSARMIIGDGCRIGHFNHITCINRVEIGNNVLTADKVHISDNSHGYENPRMPIAKQNVVSKGPVAIGEGTWLGENVSVLSCRIGRNCVIGANSVVTRDIPDFCVAVGAPARIIKRFDEGSGSWINCRTQQSA